MHADEPVAVTRLRSAGARDDHLELELVRPIPDDDPRSGVTGVLPRVRQRLLHDAIGREVDPGRETHRLALDVQVDRKTRLRYLSYEGLELAEPRLRSEDRLVIVDAQHSHEPAHLGQGLAAGSLDGVEGLTGVAGLAALGASPGSSLNDDQADRVGDDLVQVARDTCALRRHREPRLLFPLALELGRALPQPR